MSRLFEIENLEITFDTARGPLTAVRGVSLVINKGESIGIVGESGSGKTVMSRASMGLLRGRKVKRTGSVKLEGQELLTLSNDDIRGLWGTKMAMIFQDPLSALHPYYTIGDQLSEAVLVHHNIKEAEARTRAAEMLTKVGIPSVEQRMDEYPHQLSGGMRQRVMIAMALINGPELLIADEPTTALDVTVQAQILDLLRELQKEFGTAIVLITHDLGVVADLADEVLVMYGGSAVEHAPVREIFYSPQMPYTWGLLASIPQISEKKEQLDPIPGSPPSLLNLPKGCVFAPRCTFKDQVPGDACANQFPDLLSVSTDHEARCHLSESQRTAIRSERKIGRL
jgi:peptide/nickel transport system ATP-binding protein